MKTTGKSLLSNLKFYNDYSKWRTDLGRYERWEEACEDVIGIHRKKYNIEGELKTLVDKAENLYKNKVVLASQRNLQYRKEQIFHKNERIYNCVTSFLDDIEKIQQAFFLSLCGCGVTLSFIKKYTSKLPNVIERNNDEVKNFIIEDSVEGWADSVGVLLSSFCSGKVTFPEYQGCVVRFDYSKIRVKGSLISGGFKAPGSKILKQSLERIEKLLNNSETDKQLTTVDAYDVLMHCADAVLSGGVRRAALAIIIDKTDIKLLNAKTGNWRETNKQRERSNNSVMLLRNSFTKDTLKSFLDFNDGLSDLGFVFAENEDIIFNPCVTGDTIIELSVENEENNSITQWKERIEDSVEKFEMGHYIKDDKILIKCFDTKNNNYEYMPFEKIIMTKLVDELIEIEFDGKIIKCTPEHKIYTKNRGYVEAKNLLENDILLT